MNHGSTTILELGVIWKKARDTTPITGQPSSQRNQKRVNYAAYSSAAESYPFQVDDANVTRALSYQDWKALQADVSIKEYTSDMEMYEIDMNLKKTSVGLKLYFGRL